MAEHKELYLWSAREAASNEEMDKWQRSHDENCRCARAIEEGIRQNFDGTHLNRAFLNDVITEFGFDRVNWVLANTIRCKSDDGRFSPSNKAWANEFRIPKEDSGYAFAVQSHPAVVDGVVLEARKQWRALNLFDRSHCISNQHGPVDYTDRVLVVKPSMLKDKYKSPDYQLFMAKSGFGCNPGKLGSSISGYFLKDMENATFHRSDFYGIIKHDFLPQWAWDQIMPPIRSVMAVPGESAQETVASTHWDGISQFIGCDTPMCDGLETADGLVNLYYDPNGKENGKPFNRRIEDREYYGTILINGMNKFDRPLTQGEAGHLIACLNQEQVMTPAQEETQIQNEGRNIVCD